ncbi:MAG: ATPase, T2SS/T4P/T4SS family [Candidatus Omnitrophota bacterium]|nr:ATPase, T2SS/T4P/T4SS family [Candidatus Omnitrophota bacterium]
MLVDHDQNALGEKLVQAGALTQEQFSASAGDATANGTSLVRQLLSSGLVSKAKVYETLADVYGVPYIDISNFQISPDAIKCLSGEIAHRYRAIPLFKIGETLNVTMENPADVGAVDRITQKSKCHVDVCLSAPEDIEEALRTHYGSGNAINELLATFSKERSHRYRELQKKPAQGLSFMPAPVKKEMGVKPVIQLVDLIIKQAYEEGASDIHIEPEEKMLRVRYRVDGVLHEAAEPPKEMESEIISRIKVLAEMDIAETRIPQDSRIKMDIQGKNVDMRVSTMPTVYGENVVIRILKDAGAVLDLSSLGFTDEMKKMFEGIIRHPYGMILETGPTGSGKTTTLYAALRMINTVERNIVTIEDPVEYKLPLIRQIPVNVKAGLTFPTALRSILRQDPDVIMVGEIRDQETAEIAIQSALTGHLVLSTLHANTAAGVVTRLVDMHVEPFLVASSVIGVVSQRLIRSICSKCKEEHKPTELELTALKWEGPEPLPAFKGKGCRQCHDTGYKGRVGVFEMMRMNDRIRKKIVSNASAAEIQSEARETGNASLRDDAIVKIKMGMTTIEEALKSVEIE